MNRVVIILLAFLMLDSNAQTNFNKTWILGTNFGTNKPYKFRFTQPLKIDTFDNLNSLGFSAGNSNICDSNGNLILASDGMNVYDSLGNFIDNGDTLASIDFYIQDNGFNGYSQSSIFLPFDNKIYYLFTLDATDSMLNWALNTGTLFFDRLLYHKIDMTANGGLGKVIERQKELFENDTIMKVMMTACRHANGKDWWLVKQMYEYESKYKSKNKIATFLVTKDSIYQPTITYFPEPLISYYDQIGQAMFSQDGKKYAATCRGMNKVFSADFDRCTGMFSNPKAYNVPNYSCHNPNNPGWVDSFTHGLAFSPDGDFLYIAKDYNILQLDLTENDSATAWYHVVGLDTAWNYFPGYSSLYLGFDKNIYIGYAGAMRNTMSHIDNPDMKGAGCNFCGSCILFPYNNVSTPPNMPNYDLGAEPCWPLANEDLMKDDDELGVYPNPASTTISIKSEQLRGKKVLVSMYNIVGQEVLTNECYFISAQSTFNIKSLQSGVYLLKVGEWVRKVVVE